MTKKDLFNFLLGQPDTMEIKFSSEGYTCTLGHAMAIPEWNTIYLGINSEDLSESLTCEIEAEAERSGAPSEDELNDRDAFLEALETAEVAKDWKGDPTTEDDDPLDSCAVEGGSCLLPQVTQTDDLATGVM